MNDFDQRWRTVARHAAKAVPIGPEELPIGFTTRVVATVRQHPVESWEELLSAMGLRALTLTAFLAVVGAGIGFLDWYDFRLEQPKLEETLTSQLPWL